MDTVSIIIPTLNEASNIKSLLIYLNIIEPFEIIVSDAGSQDDTVLLASSLAKVIQSPKGRGIQMNHAAEIAKGNILWFIHADCQPHPKSIDAIKDVLHDPDVIGGAFEYNLDSSKLFFRLSNFFSNRKNQIFKLIYGDMGIFIRSNIFKKMKGYKEIPIMEDIDLCRRLKKIGKLVILPYRINTSTRRWFEEGFIKNWFRNYFLQICWNLGVSPYRLAKWYQFK
jgi:rSAM/selenodomain-associated transferase 2